MSNINRKLIWADIGIAVTTYYDDKNKSWIVEATRDETPTITQYLGATHTLQGAIMLALDWGAKL